VKKKTRDSSDELVEMGACKL